MSSQQVNSSSLTPFRKCQRQDPPELVLAAKQKPSVLHPLDAPLAGASLLSGARASDLQVEWERPRLPGSRAPRKLSTYIPEELRKKGPVVT